MTARVERRSRLGALKLCAGLALSVAFLYALLAAVPLAQVAEAIRSARAEWVAAALLAIAAAYGFKILRWMLMLRSLGASPRAQEAATGFLGAVAFNNVLPFRAGDVIRVVAFERLTGVPASGQVGTLLLERLLDLLVLMLILFAALSFAPLAVLDESLLAALRLAAFAILVAILLFIAAPVPLRLLVRWIEERLPRLRRGGEALLRLSDAVHALSRPAFLMKATGLSILGWLCEGGAFYCVGRALGVAASAEAALLALAVGTLSTVVPSAPGYVGTFHYFTARVAGGFGAGAAAAAAYAILVHALLWVSTTAAGFLLLALSGLGRRPCAEPRVAASE